MRTREQIITSMCYTARHDYGIQKDRVINGIAHDMMCGMTDEERTFLWNQMAQIFDNDIAPFMEFKE